jgi:predicted TIM-barrel fold metal-dependent hydrolase
MLDGVPETGHRHHLSRIFLVIHLEHFRRFYNDTAVYGSTSALMCSYEFFGADHLLFGSDAPLGPDFGLTGETIYSIEQMDISIDQKEKIFCRNAMDLLKISV